jgi:hypothetical protein
MYDRLVARDKKQYLHSTPLIILHNYDHFIDNGSLISNKKALVLQKYY